jgi:hypothetical protein
MAVHRGDYVVDGAPQVGRSPACAVPARGAQKEVLGDEPAR